LLSEQELAEFSLAIARDKVIVDTLLQIIAKRLKSVDNRDDLIDDPAYNVKRPYLDGRYKELQWFKNILSQEEDSDESAGSTR
jgi:hypothetical protein